jgi:hypothetical protein
MLVFNDVSTAEFLANVTQTCMYVVYRGSENGKFSYGYASCLGKRSSMEDFHETRIDGVDGETVGLFGVFDGKLVSRLEETSHHTVTIVVDSDFRQTEIKSANC